jgi:hypothetical protein
VSSGRKKELQLVQEQRVVTASGFVYRLDFATGQEGNSTILIFDYPWGTFGQ